MHDSEAAVCRNCGAALTGEYCSACGEERFHEHHLSWRHFVHDAVHEFLHVDGKIFRSLLGLLFRPGFLTAEYWAGRRPRYIRPLRLYLIAAAIHLIAVSSTFYRMETFLSQAGPAESSPLIGMVSKGRHVSPAEVLAALDHAFHKAYSVTQYLAVLMFAWVPLVIYRAKRPHYVEHLIFSLHVYAAFFLYSSILSRFLTTQQWRAGPSMILMVVYLLIALRLLYGESWLRTAMKAIAVRVGLLAAEFVVIAISMAWAIFWVRVHGAGH